MANNYPSIAHGYGCLPYIAGTNVVGYLGHNIVSSPPVPHPDPPLTYPLFHNWGQLGVNFASAYIHFLQKRKKKRRFTQVKRRFYGGGRGI